jgi:SnoaL-like domain
LGNGYDLVRRYVRAMQLGAEGEDELVELFRDDAEYVEWFAGHPTVHRGSDRIREWLHASWAHQPPNVRIAIERVDVVGNEVRAKWTCDSTAFVTPSRGIDTYVVSGGRIARLETMITEPPTLR